MPRRSAKKVLAEMAIFITVMALAGHLSVNLWERVVLHSELTQMKFSLTNLKETLYTIECAYENLHKDVMDISDITGQNPDSQKPDKTGIFNPKQFQDYQVQAVFRPNVEKMIGVAPDTADDATSNDIPYHANTKDKTAETHATVYADAETLTSEQAALKNYYAELRKKGNRDDLNAAYSHSQRNSKVVKNTENVGTITRYPLKSVGAGTARLKFDNQEASPQHSSKHVQKNRVHKCDTERDLYHDNIVNIY